ncbi:MAG TPA: Asp-tRNA(Asn)/Glu-tRNA(Gln) amidotransferase subunit GatA [bacterium]|nr:Asp-tRNA(Asn)/Glu-tRNA(Gln) amidotransferase subunit GatA [bacterium]
MGTLQTLTVHEIAEGLEQKTFSAREVLQDCLEQSKKIDPSLHAYMELLEEQAAAQAEAADERRARKAVLSSLDGVPIAVKDNFCMQDVRTTASSRMLDNYYPPYDATVVRLLREAGAVFIGKTNMDAFAHGSSTETSDFFTTSNPWDIGRLPGGSSGGSAAAVAADMTIGSIGSETAGSIRQPASWSGVTGLKPTYGRVSRYGLISMCSSTDSPGPITKDVRDSALILDILAGQDPHDSTTSPQPKGDYLACLGKPIKGVKIGLPKEYFVDEIEAGVKDAIMQAVATFKKLGAEIVEISLLDPKYSIAVYTIVQRSEVSSNLARLDGNRFGHKRTDFGDEAKNRVMLGTYTLSAGYYDAYYKKAQQVRTLIVDDFNQAFKTVDVIIAPTSPVVALPKGASEETAIFGELMDVLVEPSSMAGLPGLNVPCGFSKPKNGSVAMPVGMQIMGPQFSEELILQVGYAFEQATDWHTKKPQLSQE